MSIDLNRAADIKATLHRQLNEALDVLMQNPEYRQIFRFKKDKEGKDILETDGENLHKPAYLLSISGD